MMGWQPQDSNLPAQAVFLDSGREKEYTQQVLTREAVPATSPAAWIQDLFKILFAIFVPGPTNLR